MPNLTHLSLKSLDDFNGPQKIITFIKENVEEPVQSTLLTLLEDEDEILKFRNPNKDRSETPVVQFNSRKMRWQQVYAYILKSYCGLSYKEIAEWEETTRTTARKRAVKVRDAITCDLVGSIGALNRGLAYEKLYTQGWKKSVAAYVFLLSWQRLAKYLRRAYKKRDKENAKMHRKL